MAYDVERSLRAGGTIAIPYTDNKAPHAPGKGLQQTVDSFDQLVQIARELSTRAGCLADALFGSQPQPATSNAINQTTEGGPLALRLDRRFAELAAALQDIRSEFERIEARL